jgi:uncharacterized protein with HEPN domain
MSSRDDTLAFQHMLDYAREAVDMITCRAREDLPSDRMLELALIRLVEVVGEAAGRVSQARKNDFPDIPWREVAGMRNRLIHGYDGIDLDVLWDTVELDLPPLIIQLERILQG